jgi:pimeloyl-ACP methyl ester carboxylesterase
MTAGTTAQTREKQMKKAILAMLLMGFLGCTYIKTAVRQAYLVSQKTHVPRQYTNKHLLDHDTFFVIGRILAGPLPMNHELAVVALSDAFVPGEVVDVNHQLIPGSLYVLNLPAGDYHILVVGDLDHDGQYDGNEVLGERLISVDAQYAPERVMLGLDIEVYAGHLPQIASFRFKVPDLSLHARDIPYLLTDEMFSQRMASVGFYEPATFMEAAPLMFYPLDNEGDSKVPIIFVHGIKGSPRDFGEIISKLDRNRFRPWLFYYPSGANLSQISEVFYRLCLSASGLLFKDTPLIIVAHSMGGLIVREALNRSARDRVDNQVRQFITISSPLGGHPSARDATLAPVIIPSWRDMDPNGPFIQRLHRIPLPRCLAYHLFFTFGDRATLRVGENSDGVVPLSSQLMAAAQVEAMDIHGFNATHVGVLSDDAAIERLLYIIRRLEPSRLSASPLALLGCYGIAPGMGLAVP